MNIILIIVIIVSDEYHHDYCHNRDDHDHDNGDNVDVDDDDYNWPTRHYQLIMMIMALDFKQRHFQIRVRISQYSNLNIPIFKFEYLNIQI